MTCADREDIRKRAGGSPEQDGERLGVAVAPPPCDGCPQATHCRGGLVCRAFARYVRDGRWQQQDVGHLPSRRPYLRLFRQ
jgi:hypothetical protein